MDENHINGIAKNVGGKVQEAAGKITGDVKLQAQGSFIPSLFETKESAGS